VTLASSSACRPDSTPITDAGRIDAEQSHARSVAATLRGAAKVRGAFDPPSGSLVVDAEGAKGTLAIDAASVNTGNRLRDRHRRGRDFFGVAKHAQLSYALRSLTYQAGDDGRELVESYPRAFAPQSGTPWRKRLRNEVNYRAQLGYTRFFLPGGFYRRYDMPQPWPWALHPLAHLPANFAASTLARRSSNANDALERYQRWRRERWWRNEMGDKQARFQAAETFRR
jgi:hypothetical protein